MIWHKWTLIQFHSNYFAFSEDNIDKVIKPEMWSEYEEKKGRVPTIRTPNFQFKMMV